MTLLELYPGFWRASPEFAAIQTALQPEADQLAAAIEDCIRQLCVDTATWGLPYWERALGLVPDPAASAEDRRSRCRARLRGAGSTTVGLVQSVAESYTGTQVEVVEDAAHYKVVIRFVGDYGIPPRMEDLTAALRDIMPAHLVWGYEYTWVTWGEVKKMTWGDAGKLTWAQVKGGKKE